MPEQLRSTCERLRNHRNEVRHELDEWTERYDELVKDQPVTLPKFGDVTTPPMGIVPRSRSRSPHRSTQTRAIDSGGSRFAGADSKLVRSVGKMIKSAGDQASEVANRQADQSGKGRTFVQVDLSRRQENG